METGHAAGKYCSKKKDLKRMDRVQNVSINDAQTALFKDPVRTAQ